MKKHALIIGVENYRDRRISPLQFARADALGLAERLRGGCRFDTVRVLTGESGDDEPILGNILQALGDLASEMRPEDLFLFFFAGHGLEADNHGYLMTRDTTSAFPKHGSLSLDLLRESLGQLQSGKRIILLDACRNNPAAGRSDTPNCMGDVISRDIVAAVKSPRNATTTTALLTACREGQRAYEWPPKGHGVFTHYLLEGIDGMLERGEPLDFKNLAGYTSREVRQWSQNTPNLQMPQEPWYNEYGDPEPIFLVVGTQTKVSTHSVGTGRIVELDTAEVTIESEPTGAQVSIDGRLIGTTPIIVPLKSGQYQVRAVKEGFEVCERRLQFDGNGNAVFRLELKALRILAPDPEPAVTVNIIERGRAWVPLGGGIGGDVRCLTVHDGLLIAGGSFTEAGGGPAKNIAAFDGSQWTSIGTGIDGSIDNLIDFEGGLYAATCGALWKWDGKDWAEIHKKGYHTSLLAKYEGDLFYSSDDSVFRWTGSEMRQLSKPFPWKVRAMIVHEGSLVVAGGYDHLLNYIPDSVYAIILRKLHPRLKTPAEMIEYARKNDNTDDLKIVRQKIVFRRVDSGWEPLGAFDGVNTNESNSPPQVRHLATYGGKLVASGFFLSAENECLAFPQFNGSIWEEIDAVPPFSSPVFSSGMVDSIAQIGTSLVVSACFLGQPTTVRCLDGDSWKTLGKWGWQGVGGDKEPRIKALGQFGGRLIVAGSFLDAGGAPLNNITAWDG